MYFNLGLLALVLNFGSSTVFTLIILEKKGRLNAIRELSAWVVGIITSLFALFACDAGILALFVGPVASGLVICIWNIIFLRKRINFKLSKRWLKENLKVGFPAMPKAMSGYVMNACDRFLIQRWLSFE